MVLEKLPNEASAVAAADMEPPSKRQKLSSPGLTTTPPPDEQQDIAMIMDPTIDMTKVEDVHLLREKSVGILYYVDKQNPGFSGILKQRYTDFLVNEIDPDGNVLHLTGMLVPKNISSKQDKVSPEVKQEQNSGPSQQTKQHDTNPTSKKVPHGIPKRTTPPAFHITNEDFALLQKYFGQATRSALLVLNTNYLANPDAKPASFGSVLTDPISDRQLRTKIHQDLRRIFSSVFETSADANGAIKICVAVRANPNPRNTALNGHNQQNVQEAGHQKGKLGWDNVGGEYLHFNLYKENRDTMELINFIASRLKRKNKDFTFAGTKDRRAVTVQRVSAFRIRAHDLAKLNGHVWGAKFGNFKYEKHDLRLGELSGNEFLITLRDCKFNFETVEMPRGELYAAINIVESALHNLQINGFINYFGLQRFGSYGVGTNSVGMRILQGDYEGAVDCILAYDSNILEAALIPREEQSSEQMLYPKDDMDRAWAIFKFKRTGDSRKALDRLPRRFAAEAEVIKHLSPPHRSKDFLGALLKIPRNLRMLYAHAYQSMVWNHVASERWARFGGKVIEGDLVYASSDPKIATPEEEEEEVDQDGEVVVRPAADDLAINPEDMFRRARPLTAEEAISGKYSIFDIVLPTPGYDIEYPGNDIGDFYKEFMATEKAGHLDPAKMRRSVKDFSLSGSYRKFLSSIGKDWSFDVRHYYPINEPLVYTDVDSMGHGPVNKLQKPMLPASTIKTEHPAPEIKTDGQVSVISNSSMGLNADSAARQKAADAWKALPYELAKAESTGNDDLFTTRQTESAAEVPQTTYKETYIQTSIESGKSERTGNKTVILVPGTDGSEMPPPLLSRPLGFGLDICLASLGTSILPTHLTTGPELSGDAPVPPPTPMKNEAPASSFGSPSEGAVPTTHPRLAVLVKFQLGSSQYATMALRELMKQGGIKSFNPEYNIKRK